MFKPDFSDIQRNGFRINQFRLFHSQEMRSNKYYRSKKEYTSAQDIFNEKIIVMKHLTERNEIDFTLYFFSKRLTYLFITTTLYLLIFHSNVASLPIISALFSIAFYVITYRKQIDFVMGDVGIKFAESIYNARINEMYNL
jgi:hypothetical protein